MNQKATSIPTVSASMRAHKGARQSSYAESHKRSCACTFIADATKQARMSAVDSLNSRIAKWPDIMRRKRLGKTLRSPIKSVVKEKLRRVRWSAKRRSWAEATGMRRKPITNEQVNTNARARLCLTPGGLFGTVRCY